MFLKLLSGFFTFVFAFSLGAGWNNADRKSDSELQQKVQEHMDVIVDESAAIVDDVVEEIRKDERVQKAEQFQDDVNEIVDNTVEDIHAHFGKEAETEVLPAEAVAEETEAPVEAVEAGTEAAQEAAEAETAAE